MKVQTYQELEDKKKRNIMAYRKLKLNTALEFIAMLSLIALIAICIFILAEDDIKNHDRAIEYCTNQGYSKTYCEKGFGF